VREIHEQNQEWRDLKLLFFRMLQDVTVNQYVCLGKSRWIWEHPPMDPFLETDIDKDIDRYKNRSHIVLLTPGHIHILKYTSSPLLITFSVEAPWV
jgi:hypothetical protein